VYIHTFIPYTVAMTTPTLEEYFAKRGWPLAFGLGVKTPSQDIDNADTAAAAAFLLQMEREIRYYQIYGTLSDSPLSL
jgi:hypothetical protein